MPIQVLPTIVCILFCFGSAAESPLQCSVVADGDEVAVEVSITTPHPKEMILWRPDKTTAWLQLEGIPYPFPTTRDFQNLSSFVISSKSRGTIYANGTPKHLPILNVAGTYRLIVADNTETELDNTYFVECSFEIEADDI